MRTAAFIFVVLLGLAGFAALQAAFVVSQTEQALVLQFGKPKRVITQPGLNFKIPLAETVEFFEKRILDLDTNSQEVIVADQKRLVVDAFARYKIVDPLLYYQSVRNELGATSRLENIVDSALRRVLGGAGFFDVVRDKREELMKEIGDQVNNEAKNLGIEVVDVRLKRADLPEANSQAIYRRMQTERQRESAELRAQGSEQAQRIRANADRQVTVLKAEANRDAERLRGEGDAERNRIYAEAFNKDPNFFAFYRSMQAYEEALKSGDTRMILSPNSEFFRFFNNPVGGNAAGGGVQPKGSGSAN